MAQFQHMFALGGAAMYAIAVTALVGMTLFFERLLVVHRLVGRFHALEQRLRDAARADNLAEMVKLCATAPGGLAPVLMRGVEVAMRHAERDEILSEMSRDGRRLAFRLRRGLAFLATLGSMSPFLGLFGTVVGIMQALRDIGSRGAGGLDVVATGVSEALITTAAGVLVAIIMVLLHQILRGQLNHAVLEAQVLIEDAADHFARARSPERAADRDPAAPGQPPRDKGLAEAAEAHHGPA